MSVSVVVAIRDRVLRLCGERNLTVNMLARMSAIPPSSLKNILYGKSKNPKITTIKMLCDGLGITLGEFFTTEEFDELDQEVK
ncbi:MAG: helix-turn-helix transcriptional regulator [Oscillospiraceae bacterium]|jgi:transcriptional regulator with XRE-family HTH domain|nr:helix-turn-helix transcriptional regulator [Oscillospiraceae bacterium]